MGHFEIPPHSVPWIRADVCADHGTRATYHRTRAARSRAGSRRPDAPRTVSGVRAQRPEGGRAVGLKAGTDDPSGLRRGELAEPQVSERERTDYDEHVTVSTDASRQYISCWRKIARHREEVVRYLFEAVDMKDVTQAAVLRFISDQEEPDPQDTPGFDPGAPRR